MKNNFNKKAAILAERARGVNYHPPLPKYIPDLGRDYTGLLMDPETTALINVDITNLFTEPGAVLASPDAHKIVPFVNKLAQFCRGQDIPVVWIRWVNRPDRIDLGMQGRYWGHSAFMIEGMSAEDNYWSQLYPELDLKPDDIYIKKPKFNAFWGSDLEAVLRGLGVESLIFTGLNTAVCVQVTMIDAFHRDFNPILAMDATDSFSPKKEAMMQIEMLWGRVMTADEIIAELQALVP